MSRISRSALVTYSAKQMYDLVCDIESYSSFLPGCRSGKITYQSGNELEATLEVAKGGVSYQFSTSNTMVPNESIDMCLVEGPFEELHGVWTFTPIGEEGCKVTFDLTFIMSNKLTQLALGAVIEKAVGLLVAAFERRAKKIYG